MNTRTLRTIAIMAIICIIGIAAMQVFWFRRAFDLKDKEFNQTVYVALQSVGEYILSSNNQQIPLEPLVSQLSSSYFVVQINGHIHPRALEFVLKNEFKKRNIGQDFEYGLYNCDSKKMIYGNYIILDSTQENTSPKKELPTWTNDNLYFGVYFPNKDSTLIEQMGIWLFSSIVMVSVCVFFAFTLFFIFRQKQLSEIQKDFINNITHEFKTPLSTIVISTELLKKPSIYESPEKITKYTTIIQEEVTRLKNQVENVLQIAAFDKDRVQLKFEMADLHECIQKAASSTELLLQQKNGSISLDFHANPSAIKIDQLHINNVIYNLLENAIKYSSEHPHILIWTSTENKGISIGVKDNGIGIPQEHIRKVFDRFYRVPTGNIHNVKGFGLGLYYVKMIIDAHKGRIHANSKIGEGSEFVIFLPYN